MARRRKSGGDEFWTILPWALLLSWMFCPPICILLIVLLLALLAANIYASFKKK